MSAKKIIFQSGEEMSTEPKTLYVDCSVNCTLFPLKVSDGKTINVQFIQMPPSISANIISGMELKFPDDEEKKNSVCHVLKAPQMPQDFFTNFLTEGLTKARLLLKHLVSYLKGKDDLLDCITC